MAQTNCPFNWLYNTTSLRLCQLNRSAYTLLILNGGKMLRVQSLCLSAIIFGISIRYLSFIIDIWE